MKNTVLEVIGLPHEDRADRILELNKLGFTWANLDEAPYWIDQIIAIQEDTQQELFSVTQKLWLIFDIAARFVLGKHDLYEQLSIPPVLWDGLDWLKPNPSEMLSRYARFDFSISQSGRIKLLELNADTPTGYVEASVVTPWMCEQHQLRSSNDSMSTHLHEAWGKEQPQYAACIAYGQHLEDSGTINMLVRHSGLNVTCVDCLELWVDEGILKDASGNQIERLFALYPKEWMSVDDGGEAFAYAIETENVRLTNSLHAILLQSKGLQSVIWGLHELQSDLFTPDQHITIATYMLPTYNSCVFKGNFVSKSMFGREGGSVQMYNHLGQLDVKDEAGFDTSQFFPRVYQERAELPLISLQCGDFHLLTGVFVINGVPCGLLGRAGGLITGNASHFIAMGVKTNGSKTNLDDHSL